LMHIVRRDCRGNSVYVRLDQRRLTGRAGKRERYLG
jgi:hypothetical protein